MKNSDDPRLKSSRSPESDISQATSLAVDLAKRQLSKGNASSQTINYFLKHSGRKEQLECQLLEKQIELADAKIRSLQASSELKDLYAQAIGAMKSYGAHLNEPDDSDDLDDMEARDGNF